MKIIFIMLLFAANIFSQDPGTGSSFINLYNGSASGSGGGVVITPIDPATLSPTEWYNETEHTTSGSQLWGDALSVDVLGDGGGGTGMSTVLKNGLATWYAPAFASYGGFWTVDADRLYVGAGEPLTFFVVARHTTDVGTKTNEYVVKTGAKAPPYSGQILFRWTDHHPHIFVHDNNGHNIICQIDEIDVLDGEWRIYCITVESATNDANIVLYASGGYSYQNAATSWVAIRYDTGTVGGGVFVEQTYRAEYTGIAEVIWFRNKLLTTDEINGVAKWLSDKWDVAW